MNMDKKYTTIIPTYNRPFSYVKRALDSVIAQTRPASEIIIVDDNPNNCVLSCELKDHLGEYQNVTYLKQDGNRGACAARNLGILHASTEFVAFLDDDDIWLPEKSELQLLVFSDDVDMVYCRGYLQDAFGHTTSYYPSQSFLDSVSFSDELTYDYIGSTSQAMIRRSCLLGVHGFDISLPARQDYDLWLRLALQYKIIGIRDKLFIHYMHKDGQITSDPHKALTGYRILYSKYKKYYQQNKEAKMSILYWLTSASKKAHSVLYVYYRMQLFLKRISSNRK